MGEIESERINGIRIIGIYSDFIPVVCGREKFFPALQIRVLKFNQTGSWAQTGAHRGKGHSPDPERRNQRGEGNSLELQGPGGRHALARSLGPPHCARAEMPGSLQGQHRHRAAWPREWTSGLG